MDFVVRMAKLRAVVPGSSPYALVFAAILGRLNENVGTDSQSGGVSSAAFEGPVAITRAPRSAMLR